MLSLCCLLFYFIKSLQKPLPAEKQFNIYIKQYKNWDWMFWHKFQLNKYRQKPVQKFSEPIIYVHTIFM